MKFTDTKVQVASPLQLGSRQPAAGQKGKEQNAGRGKEGRAGGEDRERKWRG